MRPFAWTNPLIFSLPEDNYGLVGSPVPILAGINLSQDEFEIKIRPLLEGADQNTVVVFLDQPDNTENSSKVRASTHIYQEFLPPVFDDKLDELKNEYMDYHVMEKVYDGKKLDLTFDRNLKIGLNFSIIMRNMLEGQIVNSLPKSPVYSDAAHKTIDTNYLMQVLIRDHPLDDLFYYNFAQTQAYSHFVHRYYQRKGKK